MKSSDIEKLNSSKNIHIVIMAADWGSSGTLFCWHGYGQETKVWPERLMRKHKYKTTNTQLRLCKLKIQTNTNIIGFADMTNSHWLMTNDCGKNEWMSESRDEYEKHDWQADNNMFHISGKYDLAGSEFKIWPKLWSGGG